jgi:hypothetical protein|tara:strand:+ start:161 stop:295 length:135 start_codon:yes stop_codon:yes gene_type:complete
MIKKNKVRHLNLEKLKKAEQQDDDELDQKQENTFDTFKYGTPQP